MKLKLVLCNCKPSQSSQIARILVEEKLAACVNIIANVQSVYRWEGKICEDGEHTLLIKTTPQSYNALKMRLCELHDYEVPEIIALETHDVLEAYAQWADAQIDA